MNQVALCLNCGQRYVNDGTVKCCDAPQLPGAPTNDEEQPPVSPTLAGVVFDYVTAAEKVIAYLVSEEGRAEMARVNRENEAYFALLKKALRPSWEQLHKPFDI